MKRIFAIIFLLLALCISSRADITFFQSVTNGAVLAGTPSTIASNNGAWTQIGNASFLPPIYSLSHGALTLTNDQTNYIEISVGGTNAPVIIAAVSPQRTNANDSDSFVLTSQSLPIFSRVVATSTNTGPVSAQIVKGVNAVQ